MQQHVAPPYLWVDQSSKPLRMRSCHTLLVKKGLLMVNLFFAEPALSSSSALDMAIDYGGVNEIGTDKQLDMLEIPGKGRCFVFLAR